MAPGILAGGVPRSFYFPEGHEAAGCFKGMGVTPEERGFQIWRPDSWPRTRVSQISLRSPPPNRTDCRCVRLPNALYPQPDFWAVISPLEEHRGKRSFDMLFLPKFQPELNFIE